MSGESAKPASSHAPAPNEQILQFATAYQLSACLYAAAQMKIADLIAEGPKHVSELARAAQANEDALYRILRALACVGIFTEVGPRAFANTPASELLRAGARESLRDMVLFVSDPFHFRNYAEFMHSVRTGGTVVKKVTGREVWEYLEEDKAEAEIFNAAMTTFSAQLAPPVLEAYDFSGLGSLVDVAGGHGFLLTSILKKHADLRGILFDLARVAPAAKSRIESLGLASRCEIVSGDFFKSVPAANNYIMKNIIHDWDDAHAVAILKNCAGAMRGKGKVILLEMVISPGNEPHFGKILDIEMLALAGGRERTEAEFAGLFSAAGLRLTRVVPTKSPMCVIESVKV
jgi:hypothetical protein